MHIIMMLIALGLACGLRLTWTPSADSWVQRWRRGLGLFLFPPLLLMMTGLAVLCMGPQGQMVRRWEGWVSYGCAIGFCGLSSFLCLKLAYEGWRTLQQTRSYSSIELNNTPSRVIDTPVLYAAQVGFWQPELVVSQGLLNTLTADQLSAVLVHEQGHHYYRDTFWFFWLGCLRSCTAWLPNTESIWQELLLLRELRADRWAAQQVDTLLLAESLLLVVSYPLMPMTSFSAAFSCVAPVNRLTERIEALITSQEPPYQSNWRDWAWLLSAFLPLLAIPFHN